MLRKKAQNLPTSTIIILVLGLVVLVLLILYFTGGMKSLWGAIQDIAGIHSETPEGQARELCNIYCSTGSQEFCNHEFTISKVKVKCSTLVAPCPDVVCK